MHLNHGLWDVVKSWKTHSLKTTLHATVFPVVQTEGSLLLFSMGWNRQTPTCQLVCTQQKPRLDTQLHSFHCVSRAKWCTKHQPWGAIVFPCERSLSSLLPVRLSFLLPPYPYLALKDLKCVFTSGLVRQSPTYQGSNWSHVLISSSFQGTPSFFTLEFSRCDFFFITSSWSHRV